MKNKKYLLWFSIIFLFLTWCGTTTPISFDSFSFDLKVNSETYKNITSNSRWPNIIKSYTQENQTGFVNSLLITRIDTKWINLSNFESENIRNTKKSFWYIFQKSKDISFSCSWINIDGKLENFYIKLKEKNQTLYFWQYFFVTNSWWYIISFGSDKENLRNNFSNSVSSMICK